MTTYYDILTLLELAKRDFAAWLRFQRARQGSE